MNMEQLLRTAASGKFDFHPQSDSTDDLAAFQPVAELALEAQARGYVDQAIAHQEHFTGKRFYRVVVIRGLTDLGREVIGDV